ncbi:common dpr-interacting protein [Holotrichia oblita]|uniref:Common dpr-interacting protein n=1 Tax=Holotrichia oblita TaxID=644536 RepID=A0ACB9SU28_HOLOL|nr:common dpr-interacting protein [Holotrichia oblita]
MEPKRYISVYLLILILLQYCAGENNNLCSLSKLDNTCRCEYKTCEVTHFPELYAECRWIELEKFPESTRFPEDIRHLDLSHNNIVSLEGSFSSETLIELTLSYNKLDYINYGFFTNMKNLKVLDLSHNNFQKLDAQMFKGLSQLTSLDLSYNKLTNLPDNIFTPLSNLQSLNLGYNDLGKFLEDTANIYDSDIDLTENLVSLNLDKLSLTDLKSTFFGEANNLKRLSLADNYFDDIPPIPTSITYFDFSGNNVTTLTVRHLNYHNLVTLHLNRMKNLQAIDKYAFYNMPNLIELYIENCPRLRELNGLAFGVIRPNPDDIKLKRFSLARSGLQSVNQTYLHLFKDLDYINLENNPFTCDCDILWLQLLNGSLYKSENIR